MREGGRNSFSPLDAMNYRVLSSDDGLGIAEIGTVCLVVWRAPVIATRFERQRLALQRVVERCPGRAGFVCVIESGVPVPDDEFRRASIDLVGSHGDQLKCVVCVIEGSGFRAAATRSVLSGMALLLPRRGFEFRITATVDAAAPVLEQYCEGVTGLSLIYAHRDVRSGLAGAGGHFSGAG